MISELNDLIASAWNEMRVVRNAGTDDILDALDNVEDALWRCVGQPARLHENAADFLREIVSDYDHKIVELERKIQRLEDALDEVNE